MSYLSQPMPKKPSSPLSSSYPLESEDLAAARLQAREKARDQVRANRLGGQTHGRNGNLKIKTLVLIDDAPIRRGLVQELKKIKASYQKIAEQIRHHETVVRPAFHYWYFERFGKRARLVEQLRAEFEEKYMLLQRMRELYTWRGLTRQKAYDRAQQDLAALKLRQEDARADADEVMDEPDNDNGNEAESGADERTGSRRSKDSRSHSEAENSEFSAGWARGHFTRGGPGSSPGPTTSREQQIKTLYRKLVQVLHPDRSADDSARSQLYWHETQEAYRSGDLPRLIQLWADCLIDVDPLSRELRVFDLLAKIAKMKVQIKEAQKERRSLVKTDPTWNFEKKSRETIAQEVSTELFEAETDLAASIRGLTREIKSFSGTPQKPRTSRHQDQNGRSRRGPHASRSRQSNNSQNGFSGDFGSDFAEADSQSDMDF